MYFLMHRTLGGFAFTILLSAGLSYAQVFFRYHYLPKGHKKSEPN